MLVRSPGWGDDDESEFVAYFHTWQGTADELASAVLERLDGSLYRTQQLDDWRFLDGGAAAAPVALPTSRWVQLGLLVVAALLLIQVGCVIGTATAAMPRWEVPPGAYAPRRLAVALELEGEGLSLIHI